MAETRVGGFWFKTFDDVIVTTTDARIPEPIVFDYQEKVVG
jgi:hypothetical protein